MKYSFDLNSAKDSVVYEINIDAIGGKIVKINAETVTDELSEVMINLAFCSIE